MDTTIQPIGQIPSLPVQTSQTPTANAYNRSQENATTLTALSLRSDNKISPSANGDKNTPEAGQREEIEASVEALNEFVHTVNRDLKFSIDEDTGKTIIKVIDQTNDQIIRQIPSDEVLAIAKALDKLKGLLIHQQA